MKAASFDYVRPASVDAAVDALAEHAGMARVLAGGQSLVPMLHMRLMRPSAVIDINGLHDALGQVEPRGSETEVGALARYKDLERSPLIGERLPLLRLVARFIGDPQVRNRGTIGGALAQADPTGEIAVSCLALGARVVARSARGERTIPIEDFFEGSYASVLELDELLVAVRFPLAPTSFRFFERGRKHNDFALLNIVAMATEQDGCFTSVRIALGGVNDRPVLATAAMELLEGRPWDTELIAQAASLALEAIDPPDDVRATAEYRRHLVPIHLRRVLTDLAGPTTS
jgi:carbon-monoxide dehydrogenase medium subunit